METEYTDLLDNLAFRLEVPIAHLWEVLVTQAPITAVVDIFVWLCVLAFTIVIFLLAKKEVDISTLEDKDLSGIGAIWGVVCAIFTFGLVCSFLAEASSIAAMLINPEYWALQHLLTLKP